MLSFLALIMSCFYFFSPILPILKWSQHDPAQVALSLLSYLWPFASQNAGSRSRIWHSPKDILSHLRAARPPKQGRGKIILSPSLLTAAGEAFFGLWPHVETTKEAVGGSLWSAAFRPSELEVVFQQHPEKKKKPKTFLFWSWCVTAVALFLLSIPSTAFWFHWNTCQFRIYFYFFYVFHLYPFEVPVVIFNAMATCSQPFRDPLVPLS